MEIVISNTNILQVAADLIVLKHADDFYGADEAVASAVHFDGSIDSGSFRFVPGINTAAREVLFIGVGPLHNFRYGQIQTFSQEAIKLARLHNNVVHHLALTIHGPGYGLDPAQALLSLVAGIVAEWNVAPSPLQRVTIAERSRQRCELLDRILQEYRMEFGLLAGRQPMSVSTREGDPGQRSREKILSFGARVEEKPRLFVAMPFADDFIDEFEIGFLESAKENKFVCERLDNLSFTGDILTEIKSRILRSEGVIALLNGHNPNVFLEIGYAWGLNKPTILVAKEATPLPFDVRGHRCIIYKNIKHLREALTREIAELKRLGALRGNNPE